MQVMLMRLMSKGEYLIVPKGTKFMGSGKLWLSATFSLKYGKLPLKLRVSLMFQGLHLSVKGFTYLLTNSLTF